MQLKILNTNCNCCGTIYSLKALTALKTYLYIILLRNITFLIHTFTLIILLAIPTPSSRSIVRNCFHWSCHTGHANIYNNLHGNFYNIRVTLLYSDSNTFVIVQKQDIFITSRCSKSALL